MKHLDFKIRNILYKGNIYLYIKTGHCFSSNYNEFFAKLLNMPINEYSEIMINKYNAILYGEFILFKHHENAENALEFLESNFITNILIK